MIKCSKCGALSKPDAPVCPECGKEVFKRIKINAKPPIDQDQRRNSGKAGKASKKENEFSNIGSLDLSAFNPQHPAHQSRR